MLDDSCKRALSSPWLLTDLLAGYAQMQKISNDVMISGLSLDSRTVEPGDLFFAVQGTEEHGLRYSEQAAARGAAALVWEPGTQARKDKLPSSVPCIKVPELRHIVGHIAGRFYQNPSAHLNVIGVTGTDGKTSVSQYIAQAYEQLEIPCGVIGTLGYGVHPSLTGARITTPDAVYMQALLQGFVSAGIPHVVIEASSHGLKQGRLNGISVDTAVFTNLGRDHLNYHTSLNDYKNSKRILFQVPGLKNTVINGDDAFGRRLAHEAGSHLCVVSYTCDKRYSAADYYVHAQKIHCGERSTEIDIHSSWGDAVIKTDLCGKFNVSNILAAAGVLLVNGHGLDEVTHVLSFVRTAPGRMEWITGTQNSPTVLVDYAHTPQALSSVLQALRETCTGKLWCVFGCGGDRDQGKREFMARAVESLADHAVITDDNPRYEDPEGIVQDVMRGFSSAASYSVIHDREQAIVFAINEAGPGDTVLIAGKGHETMQLVKGECLYFDDRKTAARCLQEYPNEA